MVKARGSGYDKKRLAVMQAALNGESGMDAAPGAMAYYRTLICLILLSVLADGSAFARSFTIGAPVVSPPWSITDLLKRSVEYLNWQLPEHTFTLVWSDAESLEKDLAAGRLDLALLPSGPLDPSEVTIGRVIASVSSAEAPNPDTGGACLMLARRGESPLSQPSVRFGADSPASVAGFLGCVHALQKKGVPTERVEKQTVFFGDLGARRILRALSSGAIDVAFVRAGYIEDVKKASGRDAAAGFDRLEERKDSLQLAHSSGLYPAPTLVAGRSVSAGELKDVLSKLLTMPANGWGPQWTIPASGTALNELTRDLRIGPYEYLRHWTMHRIWEEYKAFVLCFLVLLAGLLAHGWILEKRVKERTSELRSALEKQREAERLSQLKTEELKRVEHKAVTSQLCSVFVHEISSPLSVLQNLAHGLRQSIDNRLEGSRRLSESDFEAVDEQIGRMEEFIGRAAAIVSRVRGYARSGTRRQIFDPRSIFIETAESCRERLAGRAALTFSQDVPDGLFLQGDPLEYELVLRNLIKNAAEACAGRPSPRIDCRLCGEGRKLALSVSDNGPLISDSDWENLISPSRRSTKAEGLGLGLGIVNAIVEKYNGRVEFARRPQGGLTVTAEFEATADETAHPHH